MEQKLENRYSKKRKLESQSGMPYSQKWYESSSTQEDLHEEIQQKLKKLKLNNSPLISPKPGEGQHFPLFSKRRLVNFNENTREEEKKINEELLPTTEYEQINYILGQLYFENQMMKGLNSNDELNFNTLFSQKSMNLFTDKQYLSGDLMKSISEFYQNQNKVLYQLWKDRMNERMLE